MEQDCIETDFTKMMGIRYPIILAPMFLVSNTAMIISALEAGITAAIPALNFRTDEELRKAIDHIRSNTSGPFGINLIVNKSNPKFKQQLATCVEKEVSYIITSLGSPEEVIRQCKPKGIKVLCDVVDLKYAQKVEALGADAIIAVNNSAGGHAGNIAAKELISMLHKHCSVPIISAGGVSNGMQLKEMLSYGAVGISMGSPFIASDEAGVSQDYKEAIVTYGAKDIVLTDKLSGTPCTVINTPYVQKVGTERNFLERILSKNKRLKRLMKMLTFYKGMKALQKAAFSTTYQSVWCAGPSIEGVHSIRSVKKIVDDLVNTYWSSSTK